MATIIVFSTSERKKGERTLWVQEGQLVQTPKRASAPVVLFHRSKEDCLEKGVPYNAEVYFYFSRKTGKYEPGWENFVKAE
ncbi:UNVERIFIED_ORG: hypothetical protein J2Y81_000760 [Paraburkholderia sediminicola]|nr:hypothetical protein [Paraburkholderia sediminicola]